MIDPETKDLITVIAAGWGAVLSTLIALVGVYHRYRNSYLITGDITPIDANGGQKIRLRNISNRDHIITGWIVFLVNNRMLKQPTQKSLPIQSLKIMI